MRINNKGKLVYTQYGSKGSYYCEQCAKTLEPEHPKGMIYNKTIFIAYRDGAQRVRCMQCNNLAVRT